MVLICHSFHFHTAGEKAERKYNKSIRKSEGKVRKLISMSGQAVISYIEKKCRSFFPMFMDKRFLL